MKLCILCLSNKHSADDCKGKNNEMYYPCNVCQNRTHASVMCPTYKCPESSSVTASCSSANSVLLPVVNVTFSRGSNKVVLPCLIDTGSQVSYLSLDAINSFNIPTDNPITRNIYCVGKKVIEQGFEISVELQPPDMRKIEVPIFVKSDFSLNLKIDE